MLKNTKLIVLGLVICLTSFTTKNTQDSINGAWHTQEDHIEQTLLLSDAYFMHSTFDKVNKKFIQSRGGTFTFSGNKLIATIEFNTIDQSQIGKSISYDFVISKNKLSSNIDGKNNLWNLLDQGKGEFSGTWRMSGRMQDGKIAEYPRRARKTLKILTKYVHVYG